MTLKVKTTKYTNAATAVWTDTGTQPQITHDVSGYAEFTFPATVAVLQSFGRFENGELMVDAKSLLINRSNLLKMFKGGGR